MFSTCLAHLDWFPWILQSSQDHYCFKLTVMKFRTSEWLQHQCPSYTSSLPCPPPALAEIGDFDETQSWQHLLHNKYLPDQDDIRDKITECHRKHVWVSVPVEKSQQWTFTHLNSSGSDWCDNTSFKTCTQIFASLKVRNGGWDADKRRA